MAVILAFMLQEFGGILPLEMRLAFASGAAARGIGQIRDFCSVTTKRNQRVVSDRCGDQFFQLRDRFDIPLTSSFRIRMVTRRSSKEILRS